MKQGWVSRVMPRPQACSCTRPPRNRNLGSLNGVEEREISRTQEVHLAVSSNGGGETYRELLRQEFAFNPATTTWECEDWAVAEFNVTHVKPIRSLYLADPD